MVTPLENLICRVHVECHNIMAPDLRWKYYSVNKCSWDLFFHGCTATARSHAEIKDVRALSVYYPENFCQIQVSSLPVASFEKNLSFVR
jgi:hypothetical protein